MKEEDQIDAFTVRPKGYGIDELRYRRAYALAKYEMAKMRMAETIESVKGGFSSTGRGGILSKILGSLNYVDYAILAYRIVSKFARLRRRRK